MKCVICRTGETRPGTMTVMLELGGHGAVAVIRSVPAERCVNCGEGYLTEDAAERDRRREKLRRGDFSRGRGISGPLRGNNKSILGHKIECPECGAVNEEPVVTQRRAVCYDHGDSD